jgi:hypothetical protein
MSLPQPPPSALSPAAAGKALTHRRFLTVAGVLALVAAAALGAIGAWLQQTWPLKAAGLAALTGCVWLACARFARPEPMRKVHRRYLREFLPAMAAYVVVLPLSIMVLQRVALTPAWRVLVVLLPVLPVVLVVRAIAHFMAGLDELQQRIQLQAVTITCAIVATGTFALGFLQGADILPSVPGQMTWVLPAMFAVWGIVVGIISRRYRE